jgi:hypothetical protein
MPGRPEFQMVVASAPQEKLTSFQNTNVVALPAGQTETYNFFAPSGAICRVIGLYISVPAVPTATSGSQGCYIAYVNPNMDIAYAKSNFPDGLYFDFSMFSNSVGSGTDPASVYPPDKSALISALQNVQFDSVTPLSIAIVNSTDKSQTNARTIRVWCVQRTVGGG